MILTINVLLRTQRSSGPFATEDEANNVGNCFNLLVPELFFFLILAHPVYKM